MAWGGNGFGGNGAAQGVLTRSELCQDMNFQSLENAVRGVQSGICDGFYAMNTGLLNGFAGVTNNIAENRFAAQQCCCETNRNIDSVKYENAQNTCSIINAIKEDGDATRALMTQNEIQSLRDQLQTANFQAYQTCSPYESALMYANGCGCGCGC